MSLTIEAPDASIGFSDAKTAGRWVIGAGQKIHWRDCFIWVYQAGQVDDPVVKHNACDGQAIVSAGIEIYVGGKDGLVKM
ncbi:unnamed protein product [Discula destructiva]